MSNGLPESQALCKAEVRTHTTKAVQDWLTAANIDSGFIMRGLKNKTVITAGLGAGQIGRICKGLARKAKLSPQVIGGFSGHAVHHPPEYLASFCKNRFGAPNLSSLHLAS